MTTASGVDAGRPNVGMSLAEMAERAPELTSNGTPSKRPIGSRRVLIADGRPEVHEDHEKADAVVSVSEPVLMRLVRGEQNVYAQPSVW
jgi:hypothetical protein